MTIDSKAMMLAFGLIAGMGTAALAQQEQTKNAPEGAQALNANSSTTAIDPATAGPGPFAGWQVVTKEGVPVGTVISSPETVDGKLAFVVIQMEGTKQLKVTNGVAAIGVNALTLAVDKAFIDANTSDNFTSIVVY